MFPFFPVPMDVGQNAAIQIRAEERARTGTDVSAEETEINPQLRYDLIWQGGASHFVAIYQPRFVATHTFSQPTIDPTVVSPDTVNQTDPNDTPLSILQNFGGGLELTRPRWRLSAYQFAAYGPVTTTSLLVQVPWTGDGPPPDPNPIIPSEVTARFMLLFAQTMIFVPIRLSERASLTPGFIYNAFGGANSESRAAMAFTSGPGANLALEIAATKDDRFITTLGAGLVGTDFEGDRKGATITRAEGSQSWRHWWSRTIATDVIAGGTLGGDEISGYALYGSASAGVTYDNYGMPKYPPGAPPFGAPAGHGNRIQVGVLAKAQPWLDLFSGNLEERMVGLLAANYTVDRTTYRGQLSGAKVFNTPQSVASYSIIQVESSLRYRFYPTLSGDLGIRFGSQEFDNAIRFSSVTQVTGFLGLLWTPLPARF